MFVDVYGVIISLCKHNEFIGAVILFSGHTHISYTTCVVRKAETGISIPCNKLTSEDLQMMGDALVN